MRAERAGHSSIVTAGATRCSDSPALPRAVPRRRTRLVASIAGLAALGSHGGVRAQADAAALETVIVTGTRLPDVGPVALRTVESALLRSRNSPDAAEAFARVPGVYVSTQGGRGGVGSLFLRGAEANFTSVLIDGIQVNDPTNSRGGSFDLSLLNVDDIARIELVNGPLSSVYGSDVLGGVLNIVTHESVEKAGGRVQAELGTYDYARAGARFGGPVAGTGTLGGFASYATAGSSADPDSYNSHALGARLALEPAGAGRLDMSVRHAATEASGFPDASGGPEFAVLRDLETRESRATSLGVDWRSAARAGPELTLSGSWFDQTEQQSSPGVVPGVLDGLPANDLDNAFTRTMLTAYARFDEWDRAEAVVGLTYRLEQGDSAGQIQVAPDTWLPTSYRIERDIAAAYAELDYRIRDPLTLRASWRVDDADGWDRETTGQLSLSYTPGGIVSRMFVTWGEGFKLPSLFAVAHPLVGNPALLPERAGALEIGVELALVAGVQSELRWFKQRFRDIIDFDFETFRSVNRARVDSDGLELSVGAPLGAHLQLRAHATLLDVTVLDGGPQLTHRPELLGGIDALWSLGRRAELFFGWRYVGERYDASIPTGMRELPAYGRSDLGIEWRTSAAMSVRVSVDNLTDERYATSVGFPAAGRGVRVSWRHQFGELQ